MSLAAAAQHIASKGRNGDSMLVHMTPREVAGLHALARAHGKKITINPETGLPEAFSLKSLLPMIAGAALTYFSGGMLNPATAGMIIGGGTTLATGSLNKGLAAGLGAYGGAGLTGSIAGLSTAGAPAAGVAEVGGAGASGVPSVTAGAGTNGVLGGATPGFQSIGGETMFSQPAASQGIAGLNQQAGTLGAPTAAPAAAGVTPAATASGAPSWASGTASARGAVPMADAFEMTKPTMENLGSGFKNAMQDPTKLATFDNAKYMLAAGTPSLMAREGQGGGYDGGGDNPYTYTYDPGRTSAMPGESRYEQEYFRPRYTRMAEGGLAGFFKEVEAEAKRRKELPAYTYAPPQYQAPVLNDEADPFSGMTGMSANAYRHLMGMPAAFPARSPSTSRAALNPANNKAREHAAKTSAPSASGYGYDPATQMYSGELTQEAAPEPAAEVSGWSGGLGYAAGGVSHLGDYSDGGRLLRGPGDGVSDNIPATIADKRPARLADGEFVVPARIVSELGNGSTEAGARKLYAMMDRVQSARRKSVGKNKVAVNSRADKYLPA